MRIWADFNNVMDDGTIMTVLRNVFVPKDEPSNGQVVDVYDHEGNFCQAIVVEHDGLIVRLKLVDETWIDAETVIEAPRQRIFGSWVLAKAPSTSPTAQ